ncbi:hypothetical protein Nekkels1_52 [Cellulophaga phage Nekkels_1]|uniref:Uncharacterized protein n=1 Tax=Cellulophaga phage Nekkels_1 TaxID=2745692 RepID=A0A8E4UXH7_9CAUD|nr:hypothetical protein M1M31_gp52 [Cellulophaga phage Nekkels_1]QQO97055.1 hypothetical protein Nekkels1_52 [Cellulophaga phage Nekkels_1]QQO97148.1 hypothetical protein Nekkels2_52 [Cellulophaga phage Nekkels_2]
MIYAIIILIVLIVFYIDLRIRIKKCLTSKKENGNTIIKKGDENLLEL